MRDSDLSSNKNGKTRTSFKGSEKISLDLGSDFNNCHRDIIQWINYNYQLLSTLLYTLALSMFLYMEDMQLITLLI
jgi:hypothetical protein